MTSNKIRITAILMLFSLIISSMVMMGSLTTGEEVLTRSKGETLEIENETRTLNQNEEFLNIKIKNNGQLIIKRARITVDSITCDEDAENTSFVMEDNALLSVFEGKININAEKVMITDSTISVIKGKDGSAQSTEDGGHAQMFLVSREADMYINDTEISVNAQNGGSGTSTVYGGRGGDSNILIQAENSHNLHMENVVLHSGGGRGGDNLAGSGAGAGGNSILTLESEAMTYNSCEILSQSGEAGSTIGQAAEGGQSEFQIRADGDILMYNCDVQSIEGLSSEGDLKQKSRLQVKSKTGAFYMDHEKTGEEKVQSLSSLISSVTTIDAPVAADLHEVDVGDSPPSKEGSTNIRIYWWAEVLVTDIYENPLRNAVITYTKGSEPQIYPTDAATILLTDDNGRIDIEVEARENDNPVNYFFRAAIQGGASSSSDQVRFDNENHVTPIEITLMTIDIETVNGEDYYSGMIVGGVVTLVGFAIPGSSQNIMEGISFSLDEQDIGAGEDISNDDPPFSQWRYEWDTTVHPNGLVTLMTIGKDTGYEVEVGFLFEINQEAINHRPIIHRIRVSDSRDASKDAEAGSSVEIFVTQYASIVYINGTSWEPDWVSSYLALGKKVDEVIIKVYSGDEEIYTKNIFEADDDVVKINESGGYSYSFALDTGNYKGTNAPFAEGEYTVKLWAIDDAGLRSEDTALFTFNLTYDFYPFIDLFIEGWEPATYKDPEFIQPTFNLETKKAHTVTIRFNFTKFSDYDSPRFQARDSYRDLTITLRIVQPKGGTHEAFGPEKGADGDQYTFDVENIPDNEKGTFTILVTAEDEDGLITEMEYRARVKHIPPDAPFTIVPEEVSIKYADAIFAFPVLLLILAVAYSAIVIVNTYIQRKDQKKKKALLERMKSEEKKKKDSTIEDEIHGGVDSQKYLESTGMTAKEDFIKQLEGVKGGAQKPAQKPAMAAAAPVQAAPAKPRPKPVRITRLGGGKDTVLAAYKKVLDKAWADKVLTGDEEAILSQLRKVLGVTMAEHLELKEQKIEQQSQVLAELINKNPQTLREHTYDNIRRVAMSDGQVSPDEQAMLEELKSVLGLSSGGAPGAGSFAPAPTPAAAAPPSQGMAEPPKMPVPPPLPKPPAPPQ